MDKINNVIVSSSSSSLLMHFHFFHLQTERYWSIMHGSDISDTLDDQKRVNLVLNHTQIHWNSKHPKDEMEITGTNRFGLKVVLLPQTHICRYTCSRNGLSDYYVWHEFVGGHNSSKKIEQSSASHVWFLRPNWRQLATKENGMVGKKWLLSLAINTKHFLSHQQRKIR